MHGNISFIFEIRVTEIISGSNSAHGGRLASPDLKNLKKFMPRIPFISASE
jgi:hypothetical protein